ncbi:Fanconi anemia core complex-associated protein 24 isoform X6 [Emydura macquarii macquarii]|uniref:Fanconi anemia core complex-associated protein 24 isoform X6 n=1 Tax=Emydura macquarii macquarii TaxID=1129001 RepID=UPI00352AA223
MTAKETTPVQAGTFSIPYGHVIGNEKWRGSQIAQGLQGKIKLILEDGLGLVDFHLSNRTCILYISEADLVAGNGFKRRLVRFRNVHEQSKDHTSNPFLHKKCSQLVEASILRTVQQIPGVGKTKALLLLQHFNKLLFSSTAWNVRPQEFVLCHPPVPAACINIKFHYLCPLEILLSFS